MKTIAQPAVITPGILVLALLAAAVVFIGATGKKVPVLSNVRVDIILLVILGMSILRSLAMYWVERFYSSQPPCSWDGNCRLFKMINRR